MTDSRPRRLHRRFRSNRPILVECGGRTYPLSPHDISLAGCYSTSPAPWPAELKPDRVRIPMSAGREITCSDVTCRVRLPAEPRYRGRSYGLVLRWSVPESVAAALDDFLRTSALDPSLTSKIRYLLHEQRSLLREVQNFETAKHRRIQVLAAVIAGYLAFLVAPFKAIPSLTVDVTRFYAATGVWLSICMVALTNRYLHFLGYALRQKAYFYVAVNAHRGYVFLNDPHYYNNTVLPLGPAFDSSRAWTSTPARGGKGVERFPASVGSGLYPTVFMLFVQVLFIGGLYHFLSMLFRRAELVQTGVPGIFNMAALELALISFSILGIGWIQTAGNTCLHYHRNVWEARRISIERPNPKATGEAFRRRWLYKLTVGAMWVCVAVAASGAAYLWAPIRLVQPPFDAGGWRTYFSVGTSMLVVIMFLALKILYTKLSIYFEGVDDKTVCRREMDDMPS